MSGERQVKVRKRSRTDQIRTACVWTGQDEVKIKIRSGQVRPGQIRSDKAKVKTRSCQVTAGQCQGQVKVKDRSSQVGYKSRQVSSGQDQMFSYQYSSW